MRSFTPALSCLRRRRPELWRRPAGLPVARASCQPGAACRDMCRHIAITANDRGPISGRAGWALGGGGAALSGLGLPAGRSQARRWIGFRPRPV